MRITWSGAVSPISGRPATLGRRTLQNVEHQAAGDRAGLGKPHLDLLCQAER